MVNPHASRHRSENQYARIRPQKPRIEETGVRVDGAAGSWRRRLSIECFGLSARITSRPNLSSFVTQSNTN